MSDSPKRPLWIIVIPFILVMFIIGALVAQPAYVLEQVGQLISGLSSQEGNSSEEDAHEEDENKDENLLSLSKEARKNLRLKVGPIKKQEYIQTISVPGIIVEIPGESRVEVSTPLTGIVTGIQVTTGETVQSGKMLFRLRLTHEDLVQAQTEFLKALGQRDVEQKEVNRLQKLSQSGAIAGKLLLERKYEIEKLDAILLAFREALLLHGLNKSQIESIEANRNLLREVTISVPYIHADRSLHDEGEAVSQYFRDRYQQRKSLNQTKVVRQANESSRKFKQVNGRQQLALLDDHSHDHAHGKTPKDDPHLVEGNFTLREINVHKGASVSAGDTLCVLTNYSQLYLEGHAYEQDMPALLAAVEDKLNLMAEFHTSSSQAELIEGLKIRYLSNEVDAMTRTYHFYIQLQNELVNDSSASKKITSSNRKFLNWKYKPGQRAYLKVPVKVWKDRLVVPRDAIVQEGPNAHLFKKEGSQYRRIPVHVLYRDRKNVVISSGKEIKEGEVIALRGAQQMHMALERSGSSQGDAHSHGGHSHSH